MLSPHASTLLVPLTPPQLAGDTHTQKALPGWGFKVIFRSDLQSYVTRTRAALLKVRSVCLSSLFILTPMISPSLNAIWSPVIFAFISSVLSPEIQTPMSNCLLHPSYWVPHRHLKLNMSETYLMLTCLNMSNSLPIHSHVLSSLPILVDGNVFLPVPQAKNLRYP